MKCAADADAWWNHKTLENLTLSDNHITQISADIGRLSQSLVMLDLKNNMLTRLPHEIGLLNKLQRLYLKYVCLYK